MLKLDGLVPTKEDLDTGTLDTTDGQKDMEGLPSTGGG